MTTSSPKAKSGSLPLLKIREVARILTVSRQSVRALIDSGDLKAHALNPSRRKMKREHVRITSDSLTRFYHQRVGQELDATLLPKP